MAFFLGFAIKVPMFPFHTWLPDAHVEAPTAGSVVLAGVLLKMGTYGFLRFLLPIAPDATKELMPWFMTLALIGVIYGALVAMIQKDMKKLVAYSSVSHLGLCMLGLFALNPNGITGGILQMLNHGISTSALFLIVGIVYERRHTRLIADYGGLSKTMPIYATIFLIMTMSSIGLRASTASSASSPSCRAPSRPPPGSRCWPPPASSWAPPTCSGCYQRAMFGPISETNTKMADLNAREIAYFVPLLVAAFWIGLYPKPLMDVLRKPVDKLVTQVNPELLQAGGPGGRPARGRQARHGRHGRPPARGSRTQPRRRSLMSFRRRSVGGPASGISRSSIPQLLMLVAATVMLWPADLFVPRAAKRRGPPSRSSCWWPPAFLVTRTPTTDGFSGMFEVDGITRGFQYLCLAAGVITVLLSQLQLNLLGSSPWSTTP